MALKIEEDIKLCMAYTSTPDPETSVPYVTFKMALVDMKSGLIKSQVLEVDLSLVTPEYSKQLELVNALEKTNPEIVFPFMEYLKLGKPANDQTSNVPIEKSPINTVVPFRTDPDAR